MYRSTFKLSYLSRVSPTGEETDYIEHTLISTLRNNGKCYCQYTTADGTILYLPYNSPSDTIMRSPVLASTRQLLYKGANFGMILDVRSMIMYLLRTNCNIKRKFQTK